MVAPAAAITLSESPEQDLAQMGVGDQMATRPVSGAFDFAGRTVHADNAALVFGYSSEVGYVLVIDGQARVDRVRAESGDVLLLPPYGERIAKERFDADRLLAAWPDAVAEADPDTARTLTQMAKRDARSKFWGKTRPTQYNIGVSGDARAELDRREVVANPQIQALRFESGDARRAEADLVAHIRDALVAGDGAALTPLIDPTPFGGAGLSADAATARRLAAERLIAREPWADVLDRPFTRTSDGGTWQLTGPAGAVLLVLRQSHGALFLERIERGASQ